MGLFKSSCKDLPDEGLMQQLSAGRKDAFDELYIRYAKKMHFFFCKMLQGDREKADDFTQNIFLKLIEKPHLFDPEMRFSSWLYRIAGNMCRNEYRRLSIRNEVQTDEELDMHHYENESSIRNIDLSAFKKELETALDTFPQEHKMIFHLRFYEELSIKEISEIIDCPEGTVKSRLFYSIKKLSNLLNDYNPHI